MVYINKSNGLLEKIIPKLANELYQTINEIAMNENLKFKIKNYPFIYKSDFYIQHPNIEYLRIMIMM